MNALLKIQLPGLQPSSLCSQLPSQCPTQVAKQFPAPQFISGAVLDLALEAAEVQMPEALETFYSLKAQVGLIYVVLCGTWAV